jgi:hypothetical protein
MIKGKDYLEDPSIDGRALKVTLQEKDVWAWA